MQWIVKGTVFCAVLFVAATTSVYGEVEKIITRSQTAVHECNRLASYPQVKDDDIDAVAAEKVCAQAVREQPSNAALHFQMGRSLIKLKRYEEALRANRAAIRLNPGYALGYLGLGSALAWLNRHEEAIRNYREGIRLRPDLADAHYGLGVSLQYLHRQAEALGAYREAIRLKADYVLAYYGLALALQQLSRHEEAAEAYRSVIRLKPDYAPSHYGLGSALSWLNRPDEAMQAFQAAIRLKPDYVEAHEGLRWAQTKAKEQADRERTRAERQEVVRSQSYATQYVEVTASRLNVREGPGAEYRVIAVVKKAELLRFEGDQQGEWYKVALADGTSGWVAGRHIARATDTREAGAILDLIVSATVQLLRVALEVLGEMIAAIVGIVLFLSIQLGGTLSIIGAFALFAIAVWLRARARKGGVAVPASSPAKEEAYYPGGWGGGSSFRTAVDESDLEPAEEEEQDDPEPSKIRSRSGMEKCPDCLGEWLNFGDGLCKPCKGTGYVVGWGEAISRDIAGVSQKCDTCGGSGKCQTCKGEGYVST